MTQEEIELFPAKSGTLTATVQGRLLHSKHDPQREARRVVAELARREPPAAVFLGLGLGYQAGALLNATDRTEVLVYEPSGELVEKARELGIAAPHPRLHIAQSVRELDGFLSVYAKSGYDTLTLQNRFADKDRRLAEARSVVTSFASRLEINLNTLHRFGRLWVRNLCRNLPALLEGAGVNTLSNLFHDVPALILAG